GAHLKLEECSCPIVPDGASGRQRLDFGWFSASSQVSSPRYAVGSTGAQRLRLEIRRAGPVAWVSCLGSRVGHLSRGRRTPQKSHSPRSGNRVRPTDAAAHSCRPTRATALTELKPLGHN